MQLIKNNAFRIIGILADTSRSEEIKKVHNLKRTIDTGRPFNDCSFPVLGGLDGSFDAIKDADNMLKDDSMRVEASLFWFYNGNLKSDTLAFSSLSRGRLTDAFTIWTNMTSGRIMSRVNASAFNNLGTLYLSGVLEGRFSFTECIEQGVLLKLKFLESYYASELIRAVTNDNFKIGHSDLQRLFLWKLLKEIVAHDLMKYEQFVSMVLEFSFSAKQDFLFEVINGGKESN